MILSVQIFCFSALAPCVGRALNDSPVGLAAYILEKFSCWTDSQNRDLEDGGLERSYISISSTTQIKMVNKQNGIDHAGVVMTCVYVILLVAGRSPWMTS